MLGSAPEGTQNTRIQPSLRKYVPRLPMWSQGQRSLGQNRKDKSTHKNKSYNADLQKQTGLLLLASPTLRNCQNC